MEETPLLDKHGLLTVIITHDNFVDVIAKKGYQLDKVLLARIIILFDPAYLRIDATQRTPQDYAACIVSSIQYHGGVNYAKNEISKSIDRIHAACSMKRIDNACFYDSNAWKFNNSWINELSRRIDWLIKYRIPVPAATGSMDDPHKRTTTCKVILYARKEGGIHGVFSRDMHTYEIPSIMLMKNKRHFVIFDKPDLLLNTTFIAPQYSDWHLNDVNLGISLLTGQLIDDYKCGCNYPMGTMYIFMPSTTAMENYEAAYEKAHLALYLSHSSVELDDMIIYKLTQLIDKRKRSTDIRLPYK